MRIFAIHDHQRAKMDPHGRRCALVTAAALPDCAHRFAMTRPAARAGNGHDRRHDRQGSPRRTRRKRGTLCQATEDLFPKTERAAPDPGRAHRDAKVKRSDRRNQKGFYGLRGHKSALPRGGSGAAQRSFAAKSDTPFFTDVNKDKPHRFWSAEKINGRFGPQNPKAQHSCVTSRGDLSQYTLEVCARADP